MDQESWIVNLAEMTAENDAVAIVFARTPAGTVNALSCIPKAGAGPLPEDITAIVEDGRRAFIREAKARGLWPLPLLPPSSARGG